MSTDTDWKPGVYPSLPFSVYAGIPAVNASFLTTLARRSPFHAQYEKTHPRDSDALRLGRATHSYLLEPATFNDAWRVRPTCDRRTKSGKELYEAFVASKGDRQEITTAEWDEISILADSVRRQQCINLIVGGRAEVCVVWENAETGLLCKRRLDYERNDGWNHYITDLKTARDISPRAMALDLARYGYALAAAFSIDGWKAATGDDSLYALLAVEKGCGIVKVWEPDEDTIEAGRQDYRTALRTAAECMKTGVWPAYGDGAELLRAPEWYISMHGVGRDRIIPTAPSDPGYVVGPKPETEDEIDSFLQ